MFVAIDNKIPVNMTTDYPFVEDLLHPPTAVYKNAKKDFEDSVSKLCQRQSLVSIPVIKHSCLTKNFTLPPNINVRHLTLTSN